MCHYKSPWHHHLIFIFLTSTTTITTSQPPLQPHGPTSTTLKPSMTIIIGLLTTLFSITFLLLLYAKHCRRSSNNNYPPSGHVSATPYTARENSGIDRTIIESLPVFRFGSLTGQKDGLECAVCLSRFDQSEVLRLLPKCKHAFHVECVDTWLDAHSTCPLCRYRVDPEDIFLILGENNISRDNDIEINISSPEVPIRRVSGRHSSAGENVTNLQTSLESPALVPTPTPALATFRRSLDSFSTKKKLSKKTRKKEETQDKQHRKDGLLLGAMTSDEVRRLEHRIVVGETKSGAYRWSDVQPSDLLYLRSEMILSDVRRLKRWTGGNNDNNSGRDVINSRSMSEMTGLSRFGINEETGVLSRWLARLYEPKSGRNSSSSNV
ncbi:Zinc finger, RING/FYVE/PHD-type [Artemisia annua]|uniref:RING-type E3 ubiquitin transferase n=1 Tax=Artemisia annua TaxID=35608 RepID=A0A2U1KWF6_ARTAN|nr:Zinc finger, RING/FYVE/PHD-type [Artemisia annua]